MAFLVSFQITQPYQLIILRVLVPCIWEQWSAWSSCSMTCGGTRTSTRSVRQQAQYGGTNCEGATTKEEDCNAPSCPRKYIQGKINSWRTIRWKTQQTSHNIGVCKEWNTQPFPFRGLHMGRMGSGPLHEKLWHLCYTWSSACNEGS